MIHEIVELEEDLVIGLKTRINERDKECAEKIDNTWNKFYTDGLFNSIPHKSGNSNMTLYTNYNCMDKKDYDVVFGCFVNKVNHLALHDDLDEFKIPAGRYAKFTVELGLDNSKESTWEAIKELGLDRRYETDFELFESDDHVDIYVSIK